MKYLVFLALLLGTSGAVGLAGCNIPIDSKQPDENSVAPADVLAYRYVLSHGCKAYYRVAAGEPYFDYDSATVKHRPGHTLYQCSNPNVRVFIDDAKAK